jgi:hypothetical protein
VGEWILGIKFVGSNTAQVFKVKNFMTEMACLRLIYPDGGETLIPWHVVDRVFVERPNED